MFDQLKKHEQIYFECAWWQTKNERRERVGEIERAANVSVKNVTVRHPRDVKSIVWKVHRVPRYEFSSMRLLIFLSLLLSLFFRSVLARFENSRMKDEAKRQDHSTDDKSFAAKELRETVTCEKIG